MFSDGAWAKVSNASLNNMDKYIVFNVLIAIDNREKEFKRNFVDAL